MIGFLLQVAVHLRLAAFNASIVVDRRAQQRFFRLRGVRTQNPPRVTRHASIWERFPGIRPVSTTQAASPVGPTRRHCERVKPQQEHPNKGDARHE